MTRVNLGRDTSGRPLVVDDTWLAKLRAAEKILGFTFTIVQGSWRGSSGAAASAGTHNRGGVGDLRSWNIPAGVPMRRVLTVLRECGLIAWYRTKAQGFDPHIHAIDYGNTELDSSAARQVTAWKRGRNGLANNGPDDGPRVNIPKKAPTPKEWFEDMDAADEKKIRSIIADEVRKQLDADHDEIAQAVIHAIVGDTGRNAGSFLDVLVKKIDGLAADVAQLKGAGK